MARLKVRQKGEDRDRRGNHVSGTVKRDAELTLVKKNTADGHVTPPSKGEKSGI